MRKILNLIYLHLTLDLIQSQKTLLNNKDFIDISSSLVAFKIYEKHNGKETIIINSVSKTLDNYKQQWNCYIFKLQLPETKHIN